MIDVPVEWPFEDPPNLAVITISAIMDGSLPILRVSHDEEDGGWQFLTGGDLTEDDAHVVALRRIVAVDPSVAELADLPEGWIATRTDATSPWRRERAG